MRLEFRCFTPRGHTRLAAARTSEVMSRCVSWVSSMRQTDSTVSRDGEPLAIKGWGHRPPGARVPSFHLVRVHFQCCRPGLQAGHRFHQFLPARCFLKPATFSSRQAPRREMPKKEKYSARREIRTSLPAPSASSSSSSSSSSAPSASFRSCFNAF